MNISTIISIINIIRDSIFAFFYMNTIEDKKDYPIIIKIIPIFLTLAMLNGASMNSFFSNSLTRLFYRWICYFAFIYLFKAVSIKKAIYYSLITDVLCIIVHNVFLTPTLRPILIGEYVFVNNYYINYIICSLIVNMVCLLMYYFIWKVIPLSSVTINGSSISLMIVMTIASLYINNSLRYITDHGVFQLVEFSIYSIILQIAMIVCILLMEKIQKSLEDKSNAEILAIHSKSLLDALNTKKENDEKIKIMRHDLKNHMIAIRHLIESESKDQAIDYINKLTNEYTQSKVQIETGHPLLNSVISQKMFIAESNNIQVSLSVNFTMLTTLSDLDICIIFGNLLDNAIESCLKCQEDRYIHILSSYKDSKFVMKIENSYIGDYSTNNNIAISTKKNKDYHGYGIKNVNATLEKYHGIMNIFPDNKNNKFITTLMIPIELSN